MLQTIDEIKKAEMPAVGVINGVDNANLMSVDSTTPVVTETDVLEVEEEKEIVKEVKQAVKSAENTEVKDKEEGEEKEKEVKKEQEFSEPVEKRIGKLTKKWRTTERERDFERAKRLEAEEALVKLQATIPAENKPKREDFEDEDSFIEALTDWKIESKLKTNREVSAKKESEETEKQTASEIEQTLGEITERGSDKYPDYGNLVFDKDLVLTQEMVDVIVLSDIAEDVLYYLGKNPDVSAAISELRPLLIAKEIGKLEMKLEAEKPKPNTSSEEVEEKVEKPAPVKRLTKTPEPISPVHSTGAVDKDPSTMSAKEYRAWREKN